MEHAGSNYLTINGYDIVLDIAPDSPINLFAGAISMTDDKKRLPDVNQEKKGGDVEEAVLRNLNLSLGPVSTRNGQASGTAILDLKHLKQLIFTLIGTLHLGE